MPPQSMLHWEYLLYIFGGGALFTAFIWLAVWGRDLHVGRISREPDELHEFDGVSERDRPIPLFIALLFTTFWIWAVAYTWYSGANYLH